MAREIILDTETTGLDYRSGHRLIELACIYDLRPSPLRYCFALGIEQTNIARSQHGDYGRRKPLVVAENLACHTEGQIPAKKLVE